MAHPDCPSEAAPSGAGPQPACSACTRTGVPLSVWPAIPAPGPCPASLPLVPCPQRWPPAAAAAVVTMLSSPGDLVVVPDPGASVFAATAAGAGRRARLQPACSAALLAGSCADAGQAALAVVTACDTPGCAPGAGRPGAAAVGPGVMFAACHRALAPGGLLAVITNAACHPGHAGDITASARAAGLVYTQHIIAVHAAISGGRLRLPAAAPTRPHSSGHPAGPHRPVHSDVLLLAMEDGDLRLSVWATAQRDARAQRAGRYLPAATAHPGKMLPAIAATAISRYTQPGDLVADPMCGSFRCIELSH